VPLEQLKGSPFLVKYKEHVAATSVSFILQDRYNDINIDYYMLRA